MKRLLVLAAVLVFAGVSAVQASWSSWEDYQSYKEAKKAASEAEAEGNTLAAVSNYLKAADLAGKSATVEIQGWQMNNAGYMLITQFKKTTGYQEKIDKLSAMAPSKEKLAYQGEIADLFNLQLPLLTEAKGILEKGRALFPEEEKADAEGATETAAANDEGPAAKIKSNLDYIMWVEKFVSENVGKGEKSE